MDIQKFASQWDQLITGYNTDISNATNKIKEAQDEMNKKIQDYDTNYNNQLEEFNKLQEEQKANIDTWAETQTKNQQAQTDFNIDLINQQKEEAAQQTKNEQANAYIDYQKSLNQYGGSSEELAARGLGGTGFAKNQDIAMNITYQNRVSAANNALQKANTEFQNQINQAILTNNAALADIAYQQLVKQTELALSGFEYRRTMYNDKLSYEQSISDTYTNRINNYMSMIQSYKNSIASAQAQKTSEAQWAANYALQKQAAARQAAQQAQAQYSDTSANNKVLKTSATMVNKGFSSSTAFKEYQKLEYAAKNGITQGTLNQYLNEGKAAGIYNDSDIKKIKQHFGAA